MTLFSPSVPARRRSPVLIALAVALVGAACGSDDSTDDAGTAPQAPAVDAAEVLGEANEATADPVKVGFVTSEGGTGVDLSESREAAEATVEYANQHLGGVAGHPIELVTCEDTGDGVSATACANRFVEDGVSAVVVGQVPNADLYMPILEGAGVPWIAPNGTGRHELNSEVAFDLGGGLVAILAATAQYAQDEGYEQLVAFAIDVPAFTGLFEAFGQPTFEAAGVEVDLVAVPPGTPDASPQVASGLAGGPDAIVIFAEESLCKAFLPAIERSNTADAPLIMSGLCASRDVVDAVGEDVIDGAVVNGNNVSLGDDPEADLYRAVMQTYGNEQLLRGEGAVGYVAMLGFVRAVNAAAPTGELTPAAVLDAMRRARDVPMPGLPGGSFTCDGSAFPAMTAMCSTSTLFARVEGSTMTDFRAVDGTELLGQ